MTEARTPAEVRRWLTEALAEVLELERHEIDTTRPLIRYGLDSLAVVMVAGELEDWLGRTLPPDLLRSGASVDSVAADLAEPGVGAARSPAADEKPGVATAPSAWERLLLALVRRLVQALMRVEVSGAERLPTTGGYIVAINHLHAFDAPLLFVVLPPGTVFFAADKFQRIPIVNTFLRLAGNAIWVARGEADRDALQHALSVLRAGGRLAIAPEGRVTRPGLGVGRSGVAYLANRAAVPIVPVAISGHHRPGSAWFRLRRLPVQVSVGDPIHPRAGGGGVADLDELTHSLMVALAVLLPPEHRGAYAADADAAAATTPPLPGERRQAPQPRR